jgi:hypothetical protein
MHDTVVKLKDGRTFCGALWEWQPTRGYFTICDYDDGRTSPTRIELKDVVSAVTKGTRTTVASSPDGEDQDELERARRDGWSGT